MIVRNLVKSSAIALFVSVLITVFSIPLAFAGTIESDSYVVNGETLDMTLEDFSSDSDNYFTISFTDDANELLPVMIQKIDTSLSGNDVYGNFAYAMAVIAPRSLSVVNFNLDNFVKNAEYNNVSIGETWVSPLNIHTYTAFCAHQNDGGYVYEDDNADQLTVYMGDHETTYVEMISANGQQYLYTEEFFNDTYSFRLPIESRTCFDKGYLFYANGENYQGRDEFWQAYIYFTYAEDKDAADKIAALPEAADVTLDYAGDIAAARAAYDLLAQWEGAQAAVDATKLTAAEAKLAELQKDAAMSELDKAITDAEAVDQSKLTDAQKKVLNDAIAAAKAAKANSAATQADLVAAKAAIAAATATAQDQVAEAIKKAEEEAKKADDAKKDTSVAKKANPMTVKAKTVKAKAGKKTVFKKAKAFTVKDAKGTVTFKKANKAGGKKIVVAKNGKITVKKGLKKNKVYKVKVKVTAEGNDEFEKTTKTVTLKVKIK